MTRLMVTFWLLANVAGFIVSCDATRLSGGDQPDQEGATSNYLSSLDLFNDDIVAEEDLFGLVTEDTMPRSTGPQWMAFSDYFTAYPNKTCVGGHAHSLQPDPRHGPRGCDLLCVCAVACLADAACIGFSVSEAAKASIRGWCVVVHRVDRFAIEEGCEITSAVEWTYYENKVLRISDDANKAETNQTNQCGDPPQVEHGALIQRVVSKRGDRATYMCRAGYQFQSRRFNETIICTKGVSRWPPPPKCEPIVYAVQPWPQVAEYEMRRDTVCTSREPGPLQLFEMREFDKSCDILCMCSRACSQVDMCEGFNLPQRSKDIQTWCQVIYQNDRCLEIYAEGWVFYGKVVQPPNNNLDPLTFLRPPPDRNVDSAGDANAVRELSTTTSVASTVATTEEATTTTTTTTTTEAPTSTTMATEPTAKMPVMPVTLPLRKGRTSAPSTTEPEQAAPKTLKSANNRDKKIPAGVFNYWPFVSPYPPFTIFPADFITFPSTTNSPVGSSSSKKRMWPFFSPVLPYTQPWFGQWFKTAPKPTTTTTKKPTTTTTTTTTLKPTTLTTTTTTTTTTSKPTTLTTTTTSTTTTTPDTTTVRTTTTKRTTPKPKTTTSAATTTTPMEEVNITTTAIATTRVRPTRRMQTLPQLNASFTATANETEINVTTTGRPLTTMRTTAVPPINTTLSEANTTMKTTTVKSTTAKRTQRPTTTAVKTTARAVKTTTTQPKEDLYRSNMPPSDSWPRRVKLQIFSASEAPRPSDVNDENIEDNVNEIAVKSLSSAEDDDAAPMQRIPKEGSSCNFPPFIRNGEILSATFDFENLEISQLGDVVIYHCHDGYASDGPIAVYCRPDDESGLAQWTSLPKCTPIEIPKSGCGTPPMIGNGHISMRSYPERRINESEVNDYVQYSCSPGFSLIGRNKVLCLADGAWGTSINSGASSHRPQRPGRKNTLPTCKADPSPVYCTVPLPTVEHAHVLSKSYDSEAQSGDYVVFGCDDGYWLVGRDWVLCTLDGTWDVRAECQKFGLQQRRKK